MRAISWVNFVLGLWLIIAPFVLGYSRVPGAAAEDVVLGILIAAFSLWIASTDEAPAGLNWLVGLFGIWTIIAPFVLGYSRQSSAEVRNDVAVGIVVLVLAVVRAAGYQPPMRTPAH